MNTTAQLSPELEHQIDSIKQVIKTAKNDSIIIKSWMAWDNIIYKSDPILDFQLNRKIDSLCNLNLRKKSTKKIKNSFLRLKSSALNNLGIIYRGRGNHDSSMHYHRQSLKVRQELGDKKGVAASFNNIGNIYLNKSDYKTAIKYYHKSLKIKEEIGDTLGVVSSLNNIGIIYKDQGNNATAINYFIRGLKIEETIDDKQGIAYSLNNIGIIYADQGEYARALKYYNKSLKIELELGNKQGIATALNNLGNTYKNLGKYDKAIEYHNKSLKLREELDDKRGTASSFINLGIISNLQGDNANALNYFKQSLSLAEKINDKTTISLALLNIGMIYNFQGKYFEALAHSHRALTIALEINAALETRDASKTLWEINKKLGKYHESLDMFELYIASRDSLESEENQKEIIRQEYKYEYEKKSATDSIKSLEEKKVKDAEIARQDAEIKVKKNQQWMLFGGLALVIIFAGFIFNRFRITNQQKNIIEEQKHIVEEKNKEITDSINYAKRIQNAILPPTKVVKEYLPYSFILYKPKDIVAGDFYWMEPVVSTGSTTLLFAVCDCTGHGVPGAMVSVVCNNALNRSVREYGITEPGKILDKTREIVIQEFEKSEEDVKDGMDISLVSLTIRAENESESGKIGSSLSHSHSSLALSWAGANNPLWLIRKSDGSQDPFCLHEYKPNKQPIGKYSEQKPFTTHDIEIQKGDTIYIFTDGFADQFGGEKGKKFKSSKFKELLLSIQNKNMDEQRLIINEEFEKWTGNLEQNDDVCVIGIGV